MDATPADDIAENLARNEAAIGGKPLSQASAADLERAARVVRSRRQPATKQSAEEREARAAARLVERMLGGRRRGVEVAPRRREGAWRLSVELPLEMARRLRLRK